MASGRVRTVSSVGQGLRVSQILDSSSATVLSSIGGPVKEVRNNGQISVEPVANLSSLAID